MSVSLINNFLRHSNGISLQQFFQICHFFSKCAVSFHINTYSTMCTSGLVFTALIWHILHARACTFIEQCSGCAWTLNICISVKINCWGRCFSQLAAWERIDELVSILRQLWLIYWNILYVNIIISYYLDNKLNQYRHEKCNISNIAQPIELYAIVIKLIRKCNEINWTQLNAIYQHV
jgi:hypothetical protein